MGASGAADGSPAATQINSSGFSFFTPDSQQQRTGLSKKSCTPHTSWGRMAKRLPRKLGQSQTGAGELRRGGSHEQGTGAGGNAQGRVHPDFRRQARQLAGQRTAFRGLGDLPPERLAG